jgi:hypothetical protein
MKLANFHHYSSCGLVALTLLLQLLAISPSSAQKQSKDPTGTSNSSETAGAKIYYFIDYQTRANGWGSSYIIPEWEDEDGYEYPARGSGQYWSGSSDQYHYTDFYSTSLSSFNSGYLMSQINGLPWYYDRIWNGKTPFDAHVGYEISAGSASESYTDSRITTYRGRISQARFRFSAETPDHPAKRFPFFQVTRIWELNSQSAQMSIEPLTITLPSGVSKTDWHILAPQLETNRARGVVLIEIHEAPDVLPVNSDFDEGRIDPVTG